MTGAENADRPAGTPAGRAPSSDPHAPAGTPTGTIDGLVTLDLDRARRRGAPEAVLCDAKTVEQVAAIAAEFARLAATAEVQTGAPGAAATAPEGVPAGTVHRDAASPDASADEPDLAAATALKDVPAGTSRHGATVIGPVLFTRADEARADAILEHLPDARWDREARLLAWPPAPPTPSGGLVIVACAGTSDLAVAREAELTARYLGRPTRLIADIGIAGLHRLLERLPELREAACVVVAAGMDGALPTVVAGQIAAPVVALPTSVGYGVARGGVTAALTMLSACAPGIGVVNIDNGYGAGHLAAQIARWAPAPEV